MGSCTRTATRKFDPLFLAFVCATSVSLCGMGAASAQPRVSELNLDLSFAGAARRDLGYVATRDALRPAFGVGMRVTGRVLRVGAFELHLGARLAASTWRSAALRRTEGAFRTTLDPGLVVRGGHRPFGLSLVVGPTFGLPAIAELYAGVRTARGAHLEVALGWDHHVDRLLLGVELAYAHHRLRTDTPNALTSTHLFALRLRIGVVARDDT